ncbi:MAG: sigma-54-dependent Fis family transcriptional regulator [Aureispira sp.]|nr:sigma-54-dependent Fis family transcriptional regulator [Aureispira sp.]
MSKQDNAVKIFVVEDDPVYARMVTYIMKMNPDHEVVHFATGKECIQNLHLNPDIVSLDYSLPDTTGEDVLRKIKEHNKNIGVVILSGQQDIATAVQLLKEGAYDYITKDNTTKDRLFNAIERIKKNFALKHEVEELREELNDKYQFDNTIKGTSTAMKGVFKLLEKAAKTNITVSVTGETGTGKEMVAKSIHYNSTRKKENFVAINVSAIPSELLESELFGYEKGAFTGASTRKIGKFELANKGTLFLDEIGEMEMHLQAKLLRALQEREITRIGGNQSVKFDARIIVATHRDLTEEVNNGSFREDLYYRLLGLPIKLPPLRARDKDVLILANHFLREFSKLNDLGSVKVTQEAKNKLLSYPFPGNVRELKAVVELAAIMCTDGKIRKEDLQFNSPKKVDTFLFQEMSLKEYNRKIIHHFLDKYDKNVVLVSQKLGIGKSTIYRMLKEEEEEVSNKS